MFRFRIRNLALPVLLAVVSSCSIKEDRSVCPCLLTVGLSRVLDADRVPPALWDRGLSLSVQGPESYARSLRTAYEDARPAYEFQVPKGEVLVLGLLGVEGGTVSGQEIRWPEGRQADRLYVSSQWVDCTGEEAETTLEMYKQYARVEIAGLETFDYRMEAVAGCNGLDLAGCRALKGRFRYALACGEDGICRFLLPRQASDDLMILMYDGEGRLDNSLALGRYLTESGYDWDAPSLADIFVRIDFVTVSVSILVDDWSESFEFPYTI